MSRIRSPYCAASVRSCIAATTVSPSCCRNSSTSSSTCCWWPMSSALVGSSRSRIGAPCASARAMTARWSSPPERDPSSRPANGSSSSRAIARAAAARSSAPSRASTGRWGVRPRSTYSATVIACGHDRRLRDERDELRRLAASELAQRPPGEPHLAVGAQDPGERAQHRRLAGAVRPEQRQPLAPFDRERDTVDDPGARGLDRDVGGADHGPTVRVVRSTSAKNGAPTKAVTTPIGSSAGASAVRATTSASTRNAAPTAIDSGTITR